MEYSRRVRALPVLIVLLTLAASGCGGSSGGGAGGGSAAGGDTNASTPAGQADARAGHIVYIEQGCSNCHALADTQSGEIGRGGVIGPDLDKAKPSFDLLVERVTNGKGKMPGFSNALTPLEIRNVAAYVSSVAGK